MANNNQIYKMSNAGGFKSLTRYYDMLAGNTTWNPWSPTGAYDALATVTVPSGGVASVTFSGIPTGYKHLQLRIFAKSNRSTSAYTDVIIQVNGDTSTNYRTHALYGNGSSAASYTIDGTYNGMIFPRVGANGSGGQFGGGILDVLDYSNTTKYKTFRFLGGVDANGSGEIGLSSGFMFTNTNAISSLTFTSYSGTAWLEYSSFALYGVK